MNIYIMGNFGDLQTGHYLLEGFQSLGHETYETDIRAILKDYGPQKAQEVILAEANKNKEFNPELIVVMKGMEMTLETLNKIREIFPKAKIVNWFYDKYLGDKPIYDNKSYYETLKFYDYYFCSLKGVADRLKIKGFENARYVDEGCSPTFNKEVYMNAFQKRKYEADISFVGSLGYILQHRDRIRVLNRVCKEGYDIKLYGPVLCDIKQLGELKNFHTNISPINQAHSMVAQASLINIGIDQDPTIALAHSARLYRVMCAGGLYLTTPIKEIEKFFNYNAKNEPITGDEDLVFYYGEEDLINKIDFLLEHKEIRDKIKKNGQKKVIENHTFEKRCEEIIKTIKGEK